MRNTEPRGGFGSQSLPPAWRANRGGSMKSSVVIATLAATLLALTAGASAREVVLPAGTLLQCTLNEPNFSSATVDVGDPVLCHLKGVTSFGQQAFPRGSYLVGHLESAKNPGHFWGKGYLKLHFDRIGLPTGDLPLEAKVIATRGYKVDKQGAIDGKGHATRDVVEWMLPPLWPWKVISFPFRGPRPALKGEEPLELRLMEDIVIPQHFTQAAHPDRPPTAIIARPSGLKTAPPAGAIELAVVKRADPGGPPAAIQAASVEPGANMPVDPVAYGEMQAGERFTMVVLKSNQMIEVTKYHRDGDLLMFEDLQGRKGSVGVNEVDWRK